MNAGFNIRMCLLHHIIAIPFLAGKNGKGRWAVSVHFYLEPLKNRKSVEMTVVLKKYWIAIVKPE